MERKDGAGRGKNGQMTSTEYWLSVHG